MNNDDKLKSNSEMLTEMGINESDHNVFTNKSIEIMYDRLKHYNALKMTPESELLYFLNEILSDCGQEYVKELDQFEIKRDDIIGLDGESYINTHKDKMKKYGIHINNHMYFNKRNQTKTYGLTILKNLFKYYGYGIISKNKTETIDEKRIHTRYYYVGATEK
jgi:hypothetical protein